MMTLGLTRFRTEVSPGEVVMRFLKTFMDDHLVTADAIDNLNYSLVKKKKIKKNNIRSNTKLLLYSFEVTMIRAVCMTF